MAFCGKCGTQYEPGVKFCPGCGAATDGAQPAPDAVNDSNDIQSNKVMAILAYFGPLVLIPILAAKGSKFARYHSNQGLVLLLLCIAYSIVISILSGILLAISWRLSFLVSIITTVGSLGITVLAILGIIHAAKGETKPLPLIGGIKLLK